MMSTPRKVYWFLLGFVEVTGVLVLVTVQK